MDIYIDWEETEMVFEGHDYVGNGEFQARFSQRTITRSALYSHDTSPGMIARAHAFVKTDRPEAKVTLR